MWFNKCFFISFVLIISINIIAKAEIIKIGEDEFFDREIALYVNKNKLDRLVTNPVFYKNSLLVPAREVFEPLGAYVIYVEAEKMVYIIYKSKIMSVKADSQTAYVDATPIEMTIPSKIVNDKMLIPLRSVSETLDLDIYWDQKTNSAFVKELKTDDYIKDTNSNNTSNGQDVDLNDFGNSLTFEKDNSDKTDQNTKPSTNNTSETQITDIIIPNNNEKQSYIIKLNNKIDRYLNYNLEDNKLIIDLINVNMGYTKSTYNTNNSYVKDIRVGFENTDDSKIKTRIVFDLKNTKFSLTVSEDRTKILVDFMDNTSNVTSKDNNIFYSNGVLSIRKNDLKLEDISIVDDFSNLRNTIIVPSDNYTNNSIKVNDDKISVIDVNKINNVTSITINEEKLYYPVITEDDNYFYVKLVEPKTVFNKIVVLDPGHGGTDPGAVNKTSFIDKNAEEKKINYSITIKLANLIENSDLLKCYITRTSDVQLVLGDRPKFANEIGDLFISVHTNASTVDAPNGIETFYFDSEVQTEKGIKSKQVAEIIQKNLIANTNAKNRGVKTEPFVVIKNSKYPGVLIEVGFISNDAEVRKLVDEGYQQILADATYMGVLEVFAIYLPRR